jgi:hypothetical protein
MMRRWREPRVTPVADVGLKGLLAIESKAVKKYHTFRVSISSRTIRGAGWLGEACSGCWH